MPVLCWCAEKQNPLSLATAVASQLQEVPAQDVLLALHQVAQVLVQCFAVIMLTSPR
jgi:hypothetical protein